MSVFQIIWGLILAWLLGSSFRRTWRLEHGIPNYSGFTIGKSRGTETFVFVPPTVLFWILLVFFIMYSVSLGIKTGSIRFMALLAEVLFILSVYFPLLLVCLPFLRKRISARACAVLWLIPAFLLWQGNMLIDTMQLPRLTLFVPYPILSVIGIVWLAGFIIVEGFYLISHLIFSSEVKKHSMPETDEEILNIWAHEQEILDYMRPVKLLRSDIPAPFSMGRTRFNRCTILPKHKQYSPAELSMIFSHELHHLQRCDVDTKAFLCLCKALCWFNPLVWIAAKKASEDLERSCDEIVTENMEASDRLAYSKLLLDTAAPGRGCTTCLSAAAGTLRYRLKSVMEPRKRPAGTILLMVALFSCVMSFGLISISDARGNFSSLVLADDIQISRVYDSRTYETISRDSALLLKALDAIELEHLTGERKPEFKNTEKRCFFTLSDGRQATLTDSYLYLQDSRYVNRRTDLYLVKNAIDWESVLGHTK